jgi:hypothetical protein
MGRTAYEVRVPRLETEHPFRLVQSGVRYELGGRRRREGGRIDFWRIRNVAGFVPPDIKIVVLEVVDQVASRIFDVRVEPFRGCIMKPSGQSPEDPTATEAYATLFGSSQITSSVRRSNALIAPAETAVRNQHQVDSPELGAHSDRTVFGRSQQKAPLGVDLDPPDIGSRNVVDPKLVVEPIPIE